MENLKRRAETSRVEVKVARLKLSSEEKERAGKGNTKDAIEDKVEEKREMQEKGREGLQEQVR